MTSTRVAQLALVTLLALSSAPRALAQETDAAASDAKLSPGEKQIRQAVVDFMKQYNAHDADKVAALFAPDARMVFRDGTEVNGRDEIKQSFQEAFRETPKCAISVAVDSIRLLTGDVAVEEGATTLFPDGETLTSRSRYTVLHLKKNDRWSMQSVRVVEEESLSAYGDLQPLEFLLGEWIDEDREEVVEANFRWDENKSFLLEEFQVIRDDEVVLKGTQRIGWDPQSKHVRSWVFDTAGGFGEAVWTPVGDAWVCKLTSTTPEGLSASATRTLVRVGQDRVVLQVTDRLEGVEQLPDLSVTMVRKPPNPQ